MATLYVHIPGTGILSHEVPQSASSSAPFTIGEAPENTFPLKAPSISPRHAEIISENGGYKLRDLGSANKCWLNGIAVESAALKEGDRLRFGKIEALFLETDPGQAVVEPALSGKLSLSTPEGDTAIVQFEGTTTIGWKSGNDIRIKDPSVSGHHAQFIEQNGRYLLKDLGSTNKTYINQEPIAEAPVNDGDVVQFGAVRGLLSVQFGLRRAGGAAPGASAEELKTLAAQVETLKTQADALAKERDGLDFHNKALATQLKDVEEQLEKLKTETDSGQKLLALKEKSAATALAAAGARVTSLEESLKTAQQKAERAERELQDAKLQVDALSGDQTGQQQKIASLMQARDTLRTEKEQALTQLAEAQAKLEAESKAAAESVQKQKDSAQRLLDQENSIGELKAELGTLTGKLEAALAKRDETLEKLQSAARDRERYQAQATEEVAAAEARAAQAEKEAKTVREEAEAATRQARDANALIATLSGDQTGDRRQIAELTQTRDTLQQEKDRLSAQLAEARDEAEKARTERESLQKSLDEATARVKSLSADCDSLKAFEKSLNQRIEELTKERELAKASATDLQAQISLLCQEADETKAAGTQLQVKLDAATKEREAAKAASAELQTKLDAMTEARDEAKAAGMTAQAKADALAKERDEAKTAGTELETKLAAVTKERDDARASLAEAQVKLDAQTHESQAAQTSATGLQGKLDAATRERDEARRAAAELQAKTDALAQDLAASKTAAGELRAQLETLVRERREAQGSEAGLQTQLQELSRERDSLRAAATVATGKIAQLQQEIETLSSRPQPAAPAPAAAPVVPAPMRTLSMPGLASSAPAAPTAPVVPDGLIKPAAASAFPAVPKLSLAKEEPIPSAEPDPRHSLIEIAPPPAHDPGLVSTRPVPVFTPSGGGTPDLKKILETAPEALNSMRRSLHAFIKNQMEMSLLDEFLAGLHCIAEETRAARITPVATLSNALEMLVDDLKKIPGQINPSSLRTVSQAVDFLVTLIQEKNLALTKDPTEAHLFAVDDDIDARKTIMAALETIKLRVSSASDAREALDAFGKQQYDLVLIDVGLPDINGFELCTRLRKLPEYKKVPVVFITGAVTVQNRVQSSLSGGNDFIAKPFNLLELGVKALIWIFKGQIGMV